MKTTNTDEECEVDDVPVSPLLSVERKNRYGSVPGLPDEELAEPLELERQVMIQEWGPIFSLPVEQQSFGIKPSFDMNGDVEWGAFASVDFERYSRGFDKARYKADKLDEELRDLLIRFSVVKYRLTKAQFKVLKYLRMGIIDLDDVSDVDTFVVGRIYLRALRLQNEIRRLKDVSWFRVERELAEVLK